MDADDTQAKSTLVTLQDDREKKEFKTKAPPLDWAFNILLVKIDNGMTSKELEEVKTFFKGEEGIGGGALEEIRRPLELFEVLRKRTFLDRYNMLYLQAMLFHIGRRDLIELAQQYAESFKDVVHFKSPPPEPANGYIFVEFHVAGTDSYTQSSLEELRRHVASLVCVEPQCVTIAGIEPSASLLITLMIPKTCIPKLETELNVVTSTKQLIDLGIDRVKIMDNVVLLKDVKPSEAGALVQQMQLVDLYQKLRTTKEQLEDRELECLKLNQQLKQESAETTQLRSQTMALLMGSVFRAYSNMKIPKLSSQSALAYLQYCSRRLEQHNITKETREVILNYLDANRLMIFTRIQEAQSVALQAIQAASLELVDALERQQLGQCGSIKSELERHQLQSHKQNVVQVRRTTSVHFDEYTHRIFEEIGNLLTEEERQRLIGKYTWPENDNLANHIRNRDRPLLACLFCKEQERADTPVDTVPFVTKLLKDIDRIDLVEKFNKMISEKKQTPTQTSSKEFNQIQKQLDLVLEKLDAIQSKSNTENTPLQPNINFAPSLNVNAFKLDYGEIFRKLMFDQGNIKELPHLVPTM